MRMNKDLPRTENSAGQKGINFVLLSTFTTTYETLCNRKEMFENKTLADIRLLRTHTTNYKKISLKTNKKQNSIIT